MKRQIDRLGRYTAEGGSMPRTELASIVLALALSALPQQAQRPRDPTAPTIPAQPPADRSLACGMTIFSGGNTLDPKFEKKTPPNGLFAMHVVRPKVCNDAGLGGPLRRGPLNLPMILGPKR